MVQFANWTQSFTIATNPDNQDVFNNVHWSVNQNSQEGVVEFNWPFNNTDWKGFKIIAWTQNQNGTVEMTRRVNGIDVGTLFSLTSPPSEPPSVPTIFTDLGGPVPIVKGSRIGYRWKDTNRAGSDIFATFWSFMEFPDGLWGF